MIYLGSILMVYNIYGFVSFRKYINAREDWGKELTILNVPIILLAFFLAGYLLVGFSGRADLIMAGILFGGSVFVLIIYKLLDRIVRRIIDSEQERARLKAEEDSNKAKLTFLSSMSHEMRTPMNVILGLDALALRNPNLDEETRDQLMKIDQSGRYLLNIINNILDINIMQSEQFKVRKEVFFLDEEIDQINSIIYTLCKEKDLYYKTEIRDAVTGYYNGDRMLLKQILIEILSNAVKYTEKGGITFTAECLEENEDARKISFAISDTGIGMSPEFIENIFGLFAKEDDSSTDSRGGVGLGMVAVKEKVDLLGGEINVRSEKNVGSTFTVILPLDKAIRENAKGEALNLEGKRILIVEDVKENAEIVMDLLELEGVETDHAWNGKEGLEMFEKSAEFYYDAILMDLRMPVMDGLEATEKIRSSKRADAANVPIIALSANAFAIDIEKSLNSGMNAHLAKPADAEMLYYTISTYINKRGDQS